MAKRQLKITVMPDGNLKIDASKQPGTAQAILEELQELAELVGGDAAGLVVEKHVHGAHAHHSHGDNDHVHA